MTMNFYPARGYAGNDSVVNDAYAVYGDPSRVSFKRLFNASAAWSFAAIDLTQGVQLPNATSIAMNPGMRVRFAPNRDIFWDATLFAGVGGFNVTGKMEVDELLYAPAGITAGTTFITGDASVAGRVVVSGTWTNSGIDLTPGTQQSGGAAIAMSPGMRLRFAPARDLFWDSSLFSAAGGFHLTGKLEVDELLYAPGSFTAGGTISLAGNATIGTTGGNLGFYGAVAIAKQTGVAVTAAGIHAALTSLGLIAP
jgi:hypothetical protein